MADTIFAIIDDVASARQFVTDAVQQGFQSDKVSLVAKETVEETLEATSPGLNPAQNDYPRNPGDENLSSRPPAAHQDFNAGLEKDDYNRHYAEDVQKENEIVAEISRDNAEETVPDEEEGTAEGVAKRAGIGLGVGAAAAVAALAAPGIGLVLGSGALAASVALLARSTDKGTEEGGVPKLLEREGVPPEMLSEFVQAYDEGKAIVGIDFTDDESKLKAISALRSAGAHRIQHE